MVQAPTRDEFAHGYRQLIESLPDLAVVRIGPAGEVVGWNVGAERLFGWTSDEIRGQPADLIFTPEDRAAGVPDREMDDAARSGQAGDDRWHVRKDLGRVHVTGTMNAVRDSAGSLLGFVKVVRDDTERINALAELHESRERLSLAQGAARVGSFDWQVDAGRFIWSSELEALYGLPPGGFAGTYAAWTRMVHPEDLPAAERLVLAAIADRSSYSIEFRALLPDGSVRWMTSIGRVLTDGRDPGRRVLGVSMDITERKRAEQELAARMRQSEEQERTLEALFAHIPAGIVLVSGPPEFRVERVSVFACRLVGRSCAELVGPRVGDHHAVWGIRHPDGRLASIDELPLVRAVRRGEMALDEDWLLERADGSLVPVLCNCSPIRGADGAIRGAVSTFVDVSDRLEARERLQAANAELEQFAFIASHDLQEPLRMVGSYMGLLQRRYGPHLDRRANEYIDFAVDGAARMQRLIRSLLDFARLGRGQAKLEDVDAAAALTDALELLGERVADSGASVTHGELPQVRADRDQLVRLFQNLVGNGIKYAAKARRPVVRVEAAHEGDFWKFTVADNGIGIAPEDRERVFALFQRLHSGDEYPGTGIGLAICKRIVERHGGRIWVDSIPGEGAAFSFSLPAAADRSAER
jgi:PAS domain S-box-containing protein